ncbi:MAG TPA: tRNA (adenosine(37)-N6)-threonylcarbamoyltransferase complex dimerization subunit type 1 TsaB [Myxococcaceae bacterium]|nr:tRNA (adenosine(37)-N6)-threonylcarbamoyltransferase complex dimerization subunit type 1 TsaB [Myxococcaceae bacterium]
MLLSLDTSTLTLSLALTERDPRGTLQTIRAIDHHPPARQSELLPGAIQALLAEADVELGQLEGIAVGLGPGSFTGLRIGMSTAKALAYACGLRVAGVSSLAAMALEGPAGRPLFVTSVARRDDLYLGCYRHDGGRLEALEPETALSPEELAERIRAVPESRVLGPSIEGYGDRLIALGVDRSQIVDTVRFAPAARVAELVELPAEQSLEALFALEPHYVRASEPERNPKFPPLPGPPPTARLRDA